MKALSNSLSLSRRHFYLLFFALAFWWAFWWMGDFFRIAYEHSFLAPDATLMHFLWQKPFGSLWLIGRALLLLYRWPLAGGLMVALLLTVGSWLVGYCLRLSSRWRWLQWLPACGWMTWVAWLGLNVYYCFEPGRVFGALFLGVAVCAIDAFIIWTFKSRKHHTEEQKASAVAIGKSTYKSLMHVALLLVVFAVPMLVTHLRYPYVRPLARMQVQMLHDDWDGMSKTAHDNASLSYRPLAAYYAIALVHNGHLADQLFDIRLDYDTLYTKNRSGKADNSPAYYLIDCNYTAGLFRTAEHIAMEQMTMDGPALYTLKHLCRLALLDHNWTLARKYLRIIDRTPFEKDFVERYGSMVGSTERVAADPEFALLRQTEPYADSFESFYQAPTFLGYNSLLIAGRTKTALLHSLITNLYSKRMPLFLERCQPLMGTTPPKTIAEGMATQASKVPAILQAFPQIRMDVQMFAGFVTSNAEALRDRPGHARELFDTYKGYYPYYYFFGNLKATRKSDDQEHSNSKAGVN